MVWLPTKAPRSNAYIADPPPQRKCRPLTSNIRCLSVYIGQFWKSYKLYGLFVYHSVEPASFADYVHRSVEPTRCRRVRAQVGGTSTFVVMGAPVGGASEFMASAATDISMAAVIPFLMLMGHAEEPLVLCEIETQSSRRKHANQASFELQFGLCLKSIGQILAENQVSHFLICPTSDSLLQWSSESLPD